MVNPRKSIFTSTSRRAGRSSKAAMRSEAGFKRRIRRTTECTVWPESTMSSTRRTWRSTSGPSTMCASLSVPRLVPDAEAAEKVGGEDRRALEDHDDDERRVDVAIDVGDVLAELAHAASDAGGGDHGLRRSPSERAGWSHGRHELRHPFTN